MRVLVTGGRDFKDYELFWKTMHTLQMNSEHISIIHGNAQGTDTMANEWGRLFAKETLNFSANKQMLEEGKPDLVIAFPGGKGMVKIAREANIPVKEIL